MSPLQWGRLAALGAATLIAVALVGVYGRQPSPGNSPPVPPSSQAGVSVTILAINDFHGHLKPPLGGIVHCRSDRQDQADRRLGRRCRAHGDARQGPARQEEALRVRGGRRPDRREPAAVGGVPRRAHHRGALRHGPRDHGGRQSRVRRGQGRAAAHAERRLPPQGRLQGPTQVRGRQVPLSGGEHLRHEDRQDTAAGLRDQGVRGHPRRLHRPHPEGHAQDRVALGRHGPRVPRRGHDHQCAGARAQAAWRRGHRRADPRGRHSGRRLQRMSRHLGPHRRHRKQARQGRRPRHQRAYASRLQVRDRRPARDQRRQVRHARHRDRDGARPQDARRREPQGRQPDRAHRRLRQGARADRADRRLRPAGEAAGGAARRLDHGGFVA